VRKSVKTRYDAFHSLSVAEFMKKTDSGGKITVPTGRRGLYRLWILLMILAVLVLLGAIVYFWSQAGFVVPMTLAVLDEVTTNVWVFAAFLVLAALSFFVQYHYGSLKTRRGDVRARSILLVLLGFGVGLVVLVLRWWIDPSSSLRSLASYAVHRPFVAGCAAALVVGGLVLAVALSSREEQRRVIRVVLLFLAAFLMFGGPTYLIYGLRNVGLPYPVLVLGGFVAFFIGVLLFWRLIGKQTKLGATE